MIRNDRQILALLIVIAVFIATPALLQNLPQIEDKDLKWWIEVSELVRNFGLLALALIALPLAIWRSWTAHNQARIANKQHQLSEKGLVIDRFQKGTEMLESADVSVRLAGVYTLRELAASNPDDSYITVIDLLSDFVRERSKNRRQENTRAHQGACGADYGAFPQDLQSGLDAIVWLRSNIAMPKHREPYQRSKGPMPWPNLRKANLYNANLYNAQLSGFDLSLANLADSNLRNADFTDAALFSACLDRANLSNAVFTGAALNGAYADILHAEEGSPPIGEEPEFSNALGFQKPMENWEDFVTRVCAERPELGWAGLYQSRVTVGTDGNLDFRVLPNHPIVRFQPTQTDGTEPSEALAATGPQTP